VRHLRGDVKQYLPYLVVGVTTGAVYAIASMGLVLTYSTSGVFNFAHGAVGTLATYVFFTLRVDAGLPTPLAMAVALFGVAPVLGVVIDRLLLRRLDGAPPATYVVTSLGLLVALQGLSVAVFGADTRSVAAIFPRRTFHLFDVTVGVDQAIVVGLAVVIAVALAALLHHTRFGLRTRAVVDDRELCELAGVNTSATTTASWVLGCFLAATAGILFSPFVQLDAVLLTLLVIQAFGAAVVGRLQSIPLTNLGAYGIAIGAALATKYAAGRPSLAGLPTSLPFMVLFGVLLLAGRAWLPAAGAGRAAPGWQRRLPTGFPTRLLAGGVAVAAVLPLLLNSSRLLTATATLIFVLIFASLSLVIGLSRQVSLCHAVFAVFGATSLSHLVGGGVPYPAALLLAALAVVPIGAVVAIPAIRLSGLFLALATLGFGILAQYLLFPLPAVFGPDSLVRIPRTGWLAGDHAFYYVVLAVVTAAVLAVRTVWCSRLGRLLRALADSRVAVESLGVEPTTARVLVFCLAAFLAAIGGGLLGSLFQVVNLTSFDFFQSLVWVAVLVAAGSVSLGGSFLAAVLWVAFPAAVTSPTVNNWLPVAYGVAAIVFAQVPNGLAAAAAASLTSDGPLAALAAQRSFRLDGRRRGERLAGVGGAGAPAC
jgi:branched-subunit amino acid ABC-type transport system permease component